jgi:voltage-gated potassium channel
MIASASSGNGLSHVVQQLISSSSDTALKTVDIPKKFVGKPYREYAAHAVHTGSCILLGILANTGSVMHRKKEALVQVQKSADISTLLPNLRKVKHIVANQPLINPSPDYVIEAHDRGIIIEGSSHA